VVTDYSGMQQLTTSLGSGRLDAVETSRAARPEYLRAVSVAKWPEFLLTQRRCIVFAARYELNLYMLCRRK
jgi:hypothetical protein